jgi:hypothetical protein
MNPRYLFIGILIGTLLMGCAGNKVTLDNDGLPASVSDMQNILDNDEPVRPYSRYIYTITDKNGSRAASGVISMQFPDERDIWLAVSGSKLKITASPSFVRSNELLMGDSEEIPFGGGRCAGGMLAIMPDLSRPVEFKPPWFPANAAISADRNGSLLVRLKDASPRTELQRLVEFIDTRTRLEKARCEILGTFQDVPQLRDLVKDLKRQGKYEGATSYVLSLNWGDTFALVRIVRKD